MAIANLLGKIIEAVGRIGSHPAGLVALGVTLAPLRFQLYKLLFGLKYTPREIYRKFPELERAGISYREFERYIL